MFLNCSALTSVEMTNIMFDNQGFITCASMFQNCYNLKTIDMSNFKTPNCLDMTSMFAECINVISINLSGWNTSNVQNMNNMFYDFASNAKDGRKRTSTVYLTVDLSDFSFEKLKTCEYMFNTEAKGGYNDFIKKIKMPSEAARANAKDLTNCQRMFRKRAHLEEIECLGLLSTSGELTMAQSMFSECNMLETIDISSMNLSNVTNTQYMFNFAQNQTPDRLTTIYVSSDPSCAFDSSKVTNSGDMFKGRKLLTGQDGTTCNGSSNITITYARIDDRANNMPGYFTAK